MASIYVADETKKKVDKLAEVENRTINRQIDFMCDQRFKLLGLKLPETEDSESE